MGFVKFLIVIAGVIFCVVGFLHVQEGMPSYGRRSVADLQIDTNIVLSGIAYILCGVASGVFALAINPKTPYPTEKKGHSSNKPYSSPQNPFVRKEQYVAPSKPFTQDKFEAEVQIESDKIPEKDGKLRATRRP